MSTRMLRSLRRPLLTGLFLLLTAAPIEAQTQEVVEYYAVDALGSVRVVFDAAGAVTARSDYLPFGEAWAPSGNLPAVRFTGQQRDAEEGWDHFNARNLNVRMGRFNRVDPIGGSSANPQSWNRYAYVANNPLSFTDPTGMYSTPSTGCNQAAGAYWCPGAHMLGNVDDHFNPDQYGYQGGMEMLAGELAYAAGEQPGAQSPNSKPKPTTAPADGALTVGLVRPGIKTVVSVSAAVAEPTPLGELVLLAGMTDALMLLGNATSAGESKPAGNGYFFHCNSSGGWGPFQQ